MVCVALGLIYTEHDFQLLFYSVLFIVTSYYLLPVYPLRYNFPLISILFFCSGPLGGGDGRVSQGAPAGLMSGRHRHERAEEKTGPVPRPRSATTVPSVRGESVFFCPQSIM